METASSTLTQVIHYLNSCGVRVTVGVAGWGSKGDPSQIYGRSQRLRADTFELSDRAQTETGHAVITLQPRRDWSVDYNFRRLHLDHYNIHSWRKSGSCS